VSEGRSAQLLGAGVEGAAWALTSAATLERGERLLAALDSKQHAERVLASYANLGEGQRAGHMFELLHTHSFNLDAIDKGSPLRATMLSMAGQPTGAADLQIATGHGDVVAAVQAKLYESTSQTASAVAHYKYEDMARLVASDKLAGVENLLDRRLEMNPDGVNYARYEDARAHLTDRVSVGGVQSDAVTRSEAILAGNDPTGWAESEVHREAVAKLRGDMLHGAALGAVLGGSGALLIEGVRQTSRVRAGEVSASRAAITAVGAAAKGAARGAAVSGLGAGIDGAARLELVLPQALGNAALPYALARGAISVGEAGFALARGDIDAAEFAARSGEAVLTTTLVYSFSTVGQILCPVPVLGGLVGGVAGQLAAATIVKGLRLAIAASRLAGVEEAALRQLEAEVLVALEVEAAMREAVGALAAEFETAMRDVVYPTLRAIETSLDGDGDHDDVIGGLAAITRQFGGSPCFTTVGEFNDWMLSDTPLLLNPNPGS